MGITDTMRDTLLLEFSQVRATLTDPRVPLCLPSGDGTEMPLALFSLSFCCSFNLSKKEMYSKELNKEDMKMSRKGEREREGLFFFPAECENN